MKIVIVTPAPPGSRAGNRVTALRWRRILEGLGHRVAVQVEYRREPADLLVALHARKSFASIERFRRLHPARPMIVVLPGTDLYGGRGIDRALRMATLLVVLSPESVAAVPRRHRSKVRVLVQSAVGLRRRPSSCAFDVVVMGHLRRVKDPFRAALAVRRLPVSSKVRVLHLGRPLEPGMEVRARAEMKRNPRYRWRGELPHGRALDHLARARLMVLSSHVEGGPAVISEAIACGTPVVASRIDATVGLLGRRYPGLFRVGDTAALARLLERAEVDAAFYARLKRAVRRLAPTVSPARERAAWRRLLTERR